MAIKSMTGFARAESASGTQKCVVEVRSLNHRFLEISLRLHFKDFAIEKKIKDLISRKISRGFVELSMTLSDAEYSGKKLVMDENLLGQLIETAEKIKEIHPHLDDRLDISSIFAMKDVIKFEDENVDMGQRWTLMEKAVSGALTQLVEMRSVEGTALQKDITEKLDSIEKNRGRVIAIREKQSEDILEKMRGRLEKMLAEVELDPQRILTEAAILAERADITEEVTRLESHLSQFRNLLVADGPVGRKAEFIVQEINREVNTVGSKSTIYGINQLVVEIKSEVEKIREQAANIE